jgi:hypothetical protein
MSWRKSHGNAARNGRLVVLESCPADELPPAMPGAPAPPQRDSGGRFLPGNRAGAAKRVKAGSRGALVVLERRGDPAARAALAFGRRYSAHRRVELARAHGGEISAGVGALVESAGELLAASRYWAARGIADGNPDHARLAAQLVAGHRQAERDCWELASREAEARRRAAPPVPWAWSSPAEPESDADEPATSEGSPAASDAPSEQPRAAEGKP